MEVVDGLRFLRIRQLEDTIYSANPFLIILCYIHAWASINPADNLFVERTVGTPAARPKTDASKLRMVESNLEPFPGSVFTPSHVFSACVLTKQRIHQVDARSERLAVINGL